MDWGMQPPGFLRHVNDQGLCSPSLRLVARMQVKQFVKNAIRRVFHGLAGERSRLMSWPDPSPARSLSLVVG